MSPLTIAVTASLLFSVIIVKRVFIQFFKIKELRKRHVESQRDLVKGFDAGILRKTTNDIIQRRLFHIAHRSELVDSNAPFFAKHPDSLYVQLRVLHCHHLRHYHYPFSG